MSRKKLELCIILMITILLCSCGTHNEQKEHNTNKTESSVSDDEQLKKTMISKKASSIERLSRRITFRDVYGTSYDMKTNPDIPECVYDKDKFVHNEDILSYEDDQWTSRVGVDVSGHQGIIDWKKVKAAGIDFAIIRIGYRGYGHTGSINEDKYATRNIREAQKAGLDVGVYFFSQAINEQEAVEEAELALKILNGTKIELPVCFDPENILNEDHAPDPTARSSNVSGKQFTKNTQAFCKRIEEKGYKPMIYCNMLWEAFTLDLSILNGIPVWYADYEEKPQTPYDFEYWQYSNEGHVDGIAGVTDMDIQIVKK